VLEVAHFLQRLASCGCNLRRRDLGLVGHFRADARVQVHDLHTVGFERLAHELRFDRFRVERDDHQNLGLAHGMSPVIGANAGPLCGGSNGDT